VISADGVADVDIADDGRLLHVAWLKNDDGSTPIARAISRL
jgi:hypothetical protein